MEVAKPSILNISGPYAVGKDTMLNAILTTFARKIHRVGTITTRPSDPSVDPSYITVSEAEFASITSQGKWIINRQLGSNAYGTSIDEIERESASGKICIHSVYPGAAGAGSLREEFGTRLVSVALLPISGSHDQQIEELRRRMIARGREDDTIIERKLATQGNQIDYILENPLVHTKEGDMQVFDEVLINEKLDLTLNALIQLFRSRFNV